MPQTIQTYNFNIPSFTESLNQGEEVEFKFVLLDTSIPSGVTASLATAGYASIGSTAPSTGYITLQCPFLTYTPWNLNPNVDSIYFAQNVSNLYGDSYRFEPNPASGSVSSSLYPYYGDTRFAFQPAVNDVLVMILSDNSYFIANVKQVTKNASTGNLLKITLDQNIPLQVIADITAYVDGDSPNLHFKRFLLLKRYDDEQSVILQFKKPPGDTSYGFLIAETISPSVLDNINTLQAAVQTQLLSTQVATPTIL